MTVGFLADYLTERANASFYFLNTAPGLADGFGIQTGDSASAFALVYFQGGSQESIFSATAAGLKRFFGNLATQTSTTASASINMPHGTAPSSPVHGDMWTTTTGLFIRIKA